MTADFQRLSTALAGRYRLERELGRGGMATVYLAEDLKHHRRVAIKVLHSELTAGLGSERFLREIAIAARLTHPHILPLYDSGAADGFLYYVMPFVEGESLRDRLTRERQLPLEESVAIAQAIAGALGYAHGMGVVHRDIKPENILIAAGHPVVADFGIARAISAAGEGRLTQTGLAIGTPAYMSPEQASGETEVDARTDMYALGCVLYELLSGVPPFSGPTAQALLARHALDPVPPLRTVRGTVSPALEAVILRALAKAPADRFRSAAEFAEALGRAAQPGAAARSRRPGSLLAAGALLAVVALGALWLRPRLMGGSGRIESLAVLPLTNRSSDSGQEYFVDGMQEALITELSKIGALKVISRTSTLRYRRTDRRLSEIARELNVDGLIEGSAQREGDRVRISVQLIDGRTDRNLWTDSYDRDLRGVLTLHSEVAREIARQIRVTLTPREEERLSPNREVNPRAYELYVLGRYHWNQRTLDRARRAVESLRQALGADSSYAPAWAALADAYIWLGEQGGIPQAEARSRGDTATQRALRLDSTLADAHVSRGIWRLRFEWDWTGAEQELKRAVELNPGQAAAHQMYGRILSLAGRFDDALRELARARELDPLSIPTIAYLGQAYLHARQYQRAGELFREGLQIDPNHVLVRHNLGELHLAEGRWAEAVTELERSIAGSAEPSSHYLAMLGCAYARATRKPEALAIQQRLQGRLARELVSMFDLAALSTALAEPEQALAWLEQGYAARDYWLVELRAWPWFDPLRSNPRFQAIVRGVGIPR